MADHSFCRMLLKDVMGDIRKVTTPEQRKAAWAYKYEGTQSIEFHGPNEFFWHGRGCCRWEAAAHGWIAYIEKFHPELAAETVKKMESEAIQKEQR